MPASRPIRRTMERSRSIVSARSVLRISAAALGVGARTSATRSEVVTSVSWPTAEMTGTPLAAMARARTSSLNSQRSSRLPPPRVTTMTSTAGKSWFSASAKRPTAPAISIAAPRPCTRTGAMKTSMCGARRRRTCKKSRIAAPVGEVTTPTRTGWGGRGFLRDWSKSPSARSFSCRARRRASSSPAPRGWMRRTTIWYWPRAS